jgi:DNA mismatch repair protein MSH3
MACLEKKRDDGFSDIVFLYRIASGLSAASQGLNVARLCEFPESLLKRALQKSKEMEASMRNKKLAKLVYRMAGAEGGIDETTLEFVRSLVNSQ